MNTTLDVNHLRHGVQQVVKHRPVMLAYLYGSAAAGYATPQSDVDVALMLADGHGLNAYECFLMEVDIGLELEALWGEAGVDVRIINDAPLQVHGQVVGEGILLYSRDEEFQVNYEVSMRKRYFDFVPFLTCIRKAYLDRLAEGQ